MTKSQSKIKPKNYFQATKGQKGRQKIFCHRHRLSKNFSLRLEGCNLEAREKFDWNFPDPFCPLPLLKLKPLGGRHSSVVSSAPTILRPRVRIPSTPSMLFSIYIEIVTRKERK